MVIFSSILLIIEAVRPTRSPIMAKATKAQKLSVMVLFFSRKTLE